jgi:AcrR family transcriptional regulator
MGKPPKIVSSRVSRKREMVRSNLIARARVIIADKGIEATTIRDITDAADIGFGSFYIHFESKEALVEAVIDDLLIADGDEIDALIQPIDDPAAQQSTAWLYLIDKATHDPIWGWFIVRTPMALERLMQRFAGRLDRDLVAGRKLGVFDIPDLKVAETVIAGSLFALINRRLSGDLSEHQATQGVALLLRVLGMPLDQAIKLVRQCHTEARAVVRTRH